MEYKYIILAIITYVGIVVIVKSKKLASRMQAHFVLQARNMKIDAARWERTWILKLFRAMIIFLGILIIIGAYPVLFGPYNG